MSLQDQERFSTIDSQYKENKETIQKLFSQITNDLTQLNLSDKELSDTHAYLEDKVNLFRFLRTSKFDVTKAAQRVLATIQWRIKTGIVDLTLKDCMDFYQQDAFAYYHGHDTFGRPLIFVRAKYFPKQFADNTQSITSVVRPYACLMMEIARQLTWKMTCDREAKGEPVITQITVIADITQAPFIPVTPELIRTMSDILEERYPDTVNSINVLNFSWVYQGIWSVMKHLLNQEAKDSIRFTTINELEPLVPANQIPEEMGGLNGEVWSLESDEILQTYGSLNPPTQVPHTPLLSNTQSRTSSTSSDSAGLISHPSIRSESDSDIFFDATDNLSIVSVPREKLATPTRPPIQPFPPATITESPPSPPMSPTKNTSKVEVPYQIIDSIAPNEAIVPLNEPISSEPPHNNLALHSQTDSNSPHHYIQSATAGLHTGNQFMTSLVNPRAAHEIIPLTTSFNRSHRSSSIIVVEPDLRDKVIREAAARDKAYLTRNHQYHHQDALYQLPVISFQRIASWMSNVTHQIIQISFGPANGVMYWACIYVLMRGPAENTIRRILERTQWITEPNKLSRVTIGVTAALAATMSSSLSNTLERIRNSD
ncbi:Phosphatidylinositol transfer protein CSR1 [Choanephora cucurbitarum]|uniref:Phosphatidylinositol transfer protein CSR1 n=1 Tax=Choanephora cucurbitarum TaxID=101091 RepID=A0A1C7NS78_9FUNG|nr:Phosphatidylinositol transfer protein CSR1 [Choanephora cucurbitarum]